MTFRPKNTIGQIISNNIISDNKYLTYVVYKIGCAICKSSYVGQTLQYLHKRLGQHKTALNMDKIKESALA